LGSKGSTLVAAAVDGESAFFVLSLVESSAVVLAVAAAAFSALVVDAVLDAPVTASSMLMS
jgi:hypothetical protein